MNSSTPHADSAVEVLDEPVPLRRVRRQRHHGVRGGLLGGVVACRGQQNQERADFLIGQPLSPSTSALTMLVIRSSPGLLRRNLRELDAGVGQQRDLRDRDPAARSSGVAYSSSLMPNSFSAAYATAGWSAVGTPSMSMIVSIGSRAEQAATKSTSPGPDEIVDDRDRVAVDLLLDLTHVPRCERRTDQPPVHGVLRRIHASGRTTRTAGSQPASGSAPPLGQR